MIRLGNIRDIDTSRAENWMIVRAPGEIPENARHVPELSPSPELFQKYRQAFHAGEFDRRFFDEVYVPQFLQELTKSQPALALLDNLKEESEKKDFSLCCFCEDESLCHRCIIGGILLGIGAAIETEPEYIKFYKKFHGSG